MIHLMRHLATGLFVFAAACTRTTAQETGSRVAKSTDADAVTQTPGLVRELLMLDVSLGGGDRARLDTMITRPADGPPAPLVILNHGSPREASERGEMTPTSFSGQAAAFARRGYAVAVVMRRGFGKTGGAFAERPGPCKDRDYVDASRSAARDILGAAEALKKEPWVDPTRIVLVGHSAGGLSVLASAATRPPGVVAVISFAGGRGSDAPDHVCQPERLVESLREFGDATNPPALWVYAENDHFFAPALVREMFDGYRSKGAPAELVTLPPFGTDGHKFFTSAPTEAWWSIVAPFLAKNHLPVELERPRPPVALDPPASLGPPGRAAFAEYVASETVEKAFAVGGTAWGWSSGRRTRAEAKQKALETCQLHAHEPCKVVAVGDALVPP